MASCTNVRPINSDSRPTSLNALKNIGDAIFVLHPTHSSHGRLPYNACRAPMGFADVPIRSRKASSNSRGTAPDLWPTAATANCAPQPFLLRECLFVAAHTTLHDKSLTFGRCGGEGRAVGSSKPECALEKGAQMVEIQLWLQEDADD